MPPPGLCRPPTPDAAIYSHAGAICRVSATIHNTDHYLLYSSIYELASAIAGLSSKSCRGVETPPRHRYRRSRPHARAFEGSLYSVRHLTFASMLAMRHADAICQFDVNIYRAPARRRERECDADISVAQAHDTLTLHASIRASRHAIRRL